MDYLKAVVLAALDYLPTEYLYVALKAWLVLELWLCQTMPASVGVKF